MWRRKFLSWAEKSSILPMQLPMLVACCSPAFTEVTRKAKGWAFAVSIDSYLQSKHHFYPPERVSALGQEPPFRPGQPNVCFAPEADIRDYSKNGRVGTAYRKALDYALD